MNTQTIQMCWHQLFGWFSHPGRPERFPGRSQLLSRSRRAIRRGRLDLAEALIMEGGDRAVHDASCLNVLGLIAEARGKWSKARRFWSRAARADKCYGPARQNLRRYFELCQFGRTRLTVAFGDEAEFARQEIARE